ncbi:hypothetical protein [Aliikangiella sp. IMCC44359]|uniref:hypothetical protein n=1 Tax=Aliikangiella sp. IMCC44359 TaxID=3459125 RepID=UPI00403A9D60
MIETIQADNKVLAIIIRHTYQEDGIQFFTPPSYSQQLGYMSRKSGYCIPPHVHNKVERKVDYTQEVLFIKSGKVRADFYDTEKNYVKSTELNRGDVILLADGGHGFKMLEDSEMIEVKQGPHAGEEDKTRFVAEIEDNIIT